MNATTETPAHTLDDLPLARIDSVVVTNRSGSLSVIMSKQNIAGWLASVGPLEITWRPDYSAWCSVKSGKNYISFMVKVKP